MSFVFVSPFTHFQHVSLVVRLIRICGGKCPKEMMVSCYGSLPFKTHNIMPLRPAPFNDQSKFEFTQFAETAGELLRRLQSSVEML